MSTDTVAWRSSGMRLLPDCPTRDSFWTYIDAHTANTRPSKSTVYAGNHGAHGARRSMRR